MKTLMGVTEAKASLLALITQVEKKRISVTLTRNGREVAILTPIPEPAADPLARYMFGGGKIVGDIDSPASDPKDWEYD